MWAGLICGAIVAASAWAKVESRQVGCRVELDRPVLPAGIGQKAVIKVTLDALPPPVSHARPPVNLAIVLDRSGSMSGIKIEKAKEAAIEALRRLGERDLFSLVIYDDQVETLVPAQSAANTEWIEGRIRSIQAGDSTALFGGVSQGAAEVRKNLGDRRINRIILLSDGLANVGPSSPSDLGRLGAALSKEGISVTTIGVGTDYNEDLMLQLSQNSDGNSYFVESSADLPRIFASELGDVLSVVAQKVVLEIRCPKGIRPVRIIGRDGRIGRDHVRIDLNQLYGGQEKYVLVEVEVPAGAENEELTVADARVEYDDVFTTRRETFSASARARFSRSEREIISARNTPVQEAVVFNEIAVAKDQALDLADKGQREEAARQLRETDSRLFNYAHENALGDKTIVEIKTLDTDASKVEQDNLSGYDRKEMRTKSYQIRNQQMSQ